MFVIKKIINLLYFESNNQVNFGPHTIFKFRVLNWQLFCFKKNVCFWIWPSHVEIKTWHCRDTHKVVQSTTNVTPTFWICPFFSFSRPFFAQSILFVWTFWWITYTDLGVEHFESFTMIKHSVQKKLLWSNTEKMGDISFLDDFYVYV